MFHTVRLKELIIALLIPLGIGFLSSFLAGDIRGVYETLTLPAFAPPAWIFAPVWTVLYLMIGLASYLVWHSQAPARSIWQALTFYGVTLVLNLIWSPLFFRFGLYLAAFWELCALLVLSLVTTVSFALCRQKTLWLMIPYDLWLLFAAILNRSIASLNG